jgi:peptide/nickel transport system substrate-binding protein
LITVVLIFVILGVIVGVLLIAGDSNSLFSTPSPGSTMAPPPTFSLPTLTAVTTNMPTPLPPKELAVCQAEEPNTLFFYGGLSPAARNILEGIYDGPIDTRSYQFQPVILEKLPSLTDGDAALRTVQVQEGERVMGVNNGWAVDLLPGVTVFDADAQVVTFEGGVVTMTQMVVTFTLRADVTWADGQPLTADDSCYSFELAGAFDNLPLHAQLLRDRTLGYDAVDERTVVWTSVPGYRDTFYLYSLYSQNFYYDNFWHPLPRHVWGEVSAGHLINAEAAHRKPLGWGPFIVEEWVGGDHITLVRNPRYFRAAEGLPYLDRVTFRFVPDLRQALDLLLAGECDLITQDVIEGGDLAPLLEAAGAGLVQLISSPSNQWEHLDFGIEPASWVDRPDFFGDVRVRQAVAQCVDRERIARESPLYGEAPVAHSYVAAEHPAYADDQLYRWGYDASGGRALLEEVGWRDEDGDGMREASGVTGVAYGTPFSITLLATTDDPARERTAHILSENLADCGIELTVRFLPPWEFIADGPDGPVLGRQFDLALFSDRKFLDTPCDFYLSTQITGPDNWWWANNNTGYSDADYDAACRAALDAFPGTGAYVRSHRAAQRIFSQGLPVLPLYFVPKLVAARPEVSGVIMDPSQYLSDLWNIEAFDMTR